MKKYFNFFTKYILNYLFWASLACIAFANQLEPKWLYSATYGYLWFSNIVLFLLAVGMIVTCYYFNKILAETTETVNFANLDVLKQNNILENKKAWKKINSFKGLSLFLFHQTTYISLGFAAGFTKSIAFHIGTILIGTFFLWYLQECLYSYVINVPEENN